MKTILTLLIFLSTIVSAQYKHDSIKAEKGYLHYYTKGNGKPVVLLQGGPGFSNLYMRAISDSLVNYKFILIDYQGTGYSNHNNVDPSWVSNDQIIKDIDAVRKHLKIDKWTMIGHSYGGMFALQYATVYPKNVEKIITISNAGTNQQFQQHFVDNIKARLSPEDRKRVEDIKTGKIKAKEVAPGMDEAEMIILKGYFYDPQNIPKLFSTFPKQELAKVYNPKFFNAYTANIANRNIDFTKQALELNTPIRMIEAWQDPNYDGRQLLLNEKLKNSKIEFINRAGHFSWVEEPKAFYSLLKKFMQEN